MELPEKQRTRVNAALTRFKNRINRDDVEMYKHILEEMNRKHEILFDKFSDIQDQINEIFESGDKEAQVEKRDSFERLFHNTVAQARSIIENLSRPSKQKPEVFIPNDYIDP
ncbi:hypothetical protein HHI36_017099 [Cryptolaemus montrouzieri]|uniref:Uncharacterized protein n=1 Tax=Cryptolaemus montrouzieri TaxID=559131 RepID=A0ABD2NLX7_9CUCU